MNQDLPDLTEEELDAISDNNEVEEPTWDQLQQLVAMARKSLVQQRSTITIGDIGRDDNGLNELWGKNVWLHIERMTDNVIWLAIHKMTNGELDKARTVIWLTAESKTTMLNKGWPQNRTIICGAIEED